MEDRITENIINNVYRSDAETEGVSDSADDYDEEHRYDCLLLENQLCFPLYAVSKEIIRRYQPMLDELDLTYTQYIVMMVLWQEKRINVKDLGERLYLDSGTLTPLLKKLEKKEYITREHDAADERLLFARITPKGEVLRERALTIPKRMGECIKLNARDSHRLYNILYRILDRLD
jgi:DNA-binding MarR family transcriptional regulator